MTELKNKIYLKSLCYFIPNVKVPFDLEGDEIDNCIEEAKKVLAWSDPNPDQFLKPILSVVTNTSSNYFFPKGVLSFERSKLFPCQERKLEKEETLEELKNEIRKIESKNIVDYSKNLSYLLRYFTSNLPEPTGRFPGVSMFDFTNFFAAITTSIFQNKENGKNEFSIFRADISGIQDYIFSISSKHAAKNLKGRSFYVQLLSDSILYKLLQSFGLYDSNVVYNSGGNFFLLSHQLDKGRLSELIKEINASVRKEFSTSISVVFGCIDINKNEITGIKLNEKINELFDLIDIKKRQKYSTSIQNKFDDFFDPENLDDRGGSVIRDGITGEEFGLNETAYWENKGIFKSGNVSQLDESLESIPLYRLLTKKQIELGKLLKNTTFWIIGFSQLSERLKEFEFQPASLGVYHYFLDDKKIIQFKKELSNQNIIILKINSPDYVVEKPLSLGTENTYGFTFYGGKGVPVFEGSYDDLDDDDKRIEVNDAKTFNHLAFKLRAKDGNSRVVEKSGRFHRLGILRMDVDGLGWLFKEGLKANNFSLCNLPTYSAISRSLDTFFIGYLNAMWESGNWKNSTTNEIEQFKNYTQIIYSGGDDLFIVGRWDGCIAFAHKISQEFKDWIGHQKGYPALSISGGVAIISNKFPIIKGAEFAGNAEKIAKEYEVEEEKVEKNAFTLWKPLHWEWEYPKVFDLKETIARYMQKKDYRSVFQRLLSFYEMRDNQEDEGYQYSKHQWKWQLSYNIARAAERYRNDKEFCSFLKEVEHDVFCETYKGKKELKGNHNYFDLLQVAIRWADLENRTFNH